MKKITKGEFSLFWVFFFIKCQTYSQDFTQWYFTIQNSIYKAALKYFNYIPPDCTETYQGQVDKH